MIVMRDEMNCPTAEIISKMSGQNLQGICASGNGYTRSESLIHWLRLILCGPRMPSVARTRSGIAAANRNTIRTSYKSASVVNDHADDSGLGEETDIELIKGGKANDDVWMGALSPDMAKEDGEADEDVNEEDVGRRRAQSPDEKDPSIGLDGREV